MLGQIAQDHPELCGNETRIVPVPGSLSAAIDRSNGVAVLTLQMTGSAHAVKLPGVQQEIREVCPISGNRLIVFGWYQTIHVITVIDQTSGTVVDSFMAYDAVMSPDQHWLVMRGFYPLHPQVTPSEVYLLYDLSQSAAANRHGLTPYTADIPGWVVYPVVPKNAPIDPADVPDSEEHRFRSRTFQWSADSHSAVFADSMQDTLSIIVVTLGYDKIHTYVHPVSKSEVCMGAAASAGTSDLTLAHAEVSTLPVSSLVVHAEFSSLDSGTPCISTQLNLHLHDFQAARTEVYKPRERNQAVPIPRPVPESI